MDSEFIDAIRQVQQDKGIPEELVYSTVEEILLTAYQKKFGTADNAVVRMNEDKTSVSIFAKKHIVEKEDLLDPAIEVSLEEALSYDDNCELGDDLLIEVEPKSFGRVAIQSAKQKARQNLREIQKDISYSEYKDKVGQIIIGYCQQERDGNLFVDLGKAEGILPKSLQSPREYYHPGDRIKALLVEVSKTPSGLRIVLSRTHTDFVKRIFELEVPEIYDKTVEIARIVREPGYRTKVAVRSTREDVDPVGACVGFKGIRVQAVVSELEGEKIDLLRFDPDPLTLIKNALSPAQVSDVIVLDVKKKQALAVVPEQQLSLSIGKQGLNVRLANRLVDWNIDVKTEEQVAEMDISPPDLSAVASNLFSDVEEKEESDQHLKLAELSGISERVAELLMGNGIESTEDLINMAPGTLEKMEGITAEDIENIGEIVGDNPEIYECPECHAAITVNMTSCPNCGVGLSFEIEEESSE